MGTWCTGEGKLAHPGTISAWSGTGEMMDDDGRRATKLAMDSGDQIDKEEGQ